VNELIEERISDRQLTTATVTLGELKVIADRFSRIQRSNDVAQPDRLSKHGRQNACRPRDATVRPD